MFLFICIIVAEQWFEKYCEKRAISQKLVIFSKVQLCIWSSIVPRFIRTRLHLVYSCLFVNPFTVRIHLFPYRAATLAVPPVVENAEVSVVVSADSRRATATYRCTGIYTISGSQTLTFNCNAVPHVWNPAFTLCTGTQCAVKQSMYCKWGLLKFPIGA